MKKITLITSLILFAISTFAQTNLQSVLKNDKKLIVSNSKRLSQCSFSETDDEVDRGFGNNSINEVADNFIVPAGEILNANKITIRIIAEPETQFPEITVRFYNHGGGMFPATDYISEEIVVPTTQTNIGAVTDQLDAFELVLDITPVELVSVDEEDTTYWISIWASNSPSQINYIETTNNTTDQIIASYRDGSNQTAVWENSYLDTDIMQVLDFALRIIVEGNCSALSIQENITTELVSIYPNLTSSIVNVIPNEGVSIQNMALYNLYGKSIKVFYKDNKLNVSSLSKGVYILNVVTDLGVTITKKIVVGR